MPDTNYDQSQAQQAADILGTATLLAQTISQLVQTFAPADNSLMSQIDDLDDRLTILLDEPRLRGLLRSRVAGQWPAGPSGRAQRQTPGLVAVSSTRLDRAAKIAKLTKIMLWVSAFTGIAAAVVGIASAFMPSDTDEILESVGKLQQQVQELGETLVAEINKAKDVIIEEMYLQSYNDAMARIVHGEALQRMAQEYMSFLAAPDMAMACDNQIVEIWFDHKPTDASAYAGYSQVSLATTTAQQAAVTNALTNWTQAIRILAAPASASVQNILNGNKLYLALPFQDGANVMVVRARNTPDSLTSNPAGFAASLRIVDADGNPAMLATDTINWKVAPITPGTATGTAPPARGDSAWITPTSQGVVGGTAPLTNNMATRFDVQGINSPQTAQFVQVAGSSPLAYDETEPTGRVVNRYYVYSSDATTGVLLTSVPLVQNTVLNPLSLIARGTVSCYAYFISFADQKIYFCHDLRSGGFILTSMLIGLVLPPPTYTTPWTNACADFPTNTGAQWLWAGDTSQPVSTFSQEVWLKAEFNWNRQTLFDDPVSLSRQGLIANVIDYDTDDLKDDLYRVLINTVGADGGLAKGLLQQINDAHDGSPGQIQRYGQLAANLFQRGLAVLGFIEPFRAKARYLRSVGVDTPEALSETQKPEYQRVATAATRAVLDQFSSAYDPMLNPCAQIMLAIESYTYSVLTDEVQMRMAVAAIVAKAIVTQPIQTMVNTLQSEINTWYGSSSPSRVWLVVAWEDSARSRVSLSQRGPFYYETRIGDRHIAVFGTAPNIPAGSSPLLTAPTPKAATTKGTWISNASQYVTSYRLDITRYTSAIVAALGDGTLAFCCRGGFVYRGDTIAAFAGPMSLCYSQIQTIRNSTGNNDLATLIYG